MPKTESDMKNRSDMDSTVQSFSILLISILQTEQLKRPIARKVAMLSHLSTSPAFKTEKLEEQVSKVHQKLNAYTYEEFLQRVRDQQGSQCYVHLGCRFKLHFLLKTKLDNQ